MTRGITNQHHRLRNAEQEHTLNYSAAQASMRVIELESRCAVYPYRGTLSATPSLLSRLAGG